MKKPTDKQIAALAKLVAANGVFPVYKARADGTILIETGINTHILRSLKMNGYIDFTHMYLGGIVGNLRILKSEVTKN